MAVQAQPLRLRDRHIYLSTAIPETERADVARRVRQEGAVVKETPVGTCIHVLPVFDGEEFEHLKTLKYSVIGLALFLQFLQGECTLPELYGDHNILFSNWFEGIAITSTGLPKDLRERVFRLARYMGATANIAYQKKTSHLVCGGANSAKFEMARQQGAPIVTSEWVIDCWRKGKRLSEQLYCPSFARESTLESPETASSQGVHFSQTEHRFLHGCKITVIGGDGTEEPAQAKRWAHQFGGVYSSTLDDTVTHVLLSPQYLSTQKLTPTQEQNVTGLRLSFRWLRDCVAQGQRLPETSYLVHSQSSQVKIEKLAAGSDFMEISPSALVTPRVKAGSRTSSTDQLEHAPVKVEGSLFFSNVVVFISGFEEKESRECHEIISGRGGRTNRDLENVTSPSQADYHLVPHGDRNATRSDTASTPLVSPNWLELCIAEGRVLSPDYAVGCAPFRYPIPYPKTEGVRVVVTEFPPEQRRNLRMLIVILGFTYRERLKAEYNVLICNRPRGKKYASARQWRIPIVSVEWLYECVKAGSYVDPAAFQLDTKVSAKNGPVLLGVMIYLSKSLAVSEQNSIHELASELGAAVTLKWSDAITHIIHSSNRSEGPHEIRHAMIEAANARVVSPMWLQSCKTHRCWMEEKDFPCTMNPRMSLGIGSNVLQPLEPKSRRRTRTLPTKLDSLPPKKRRKAVTTLFRQREDEEIGITSGHSRRKKPKREPFLEHLSPPTRSTEVLSFSDLSESSTSVTISHGGFSHSTVDLTISPVKQPKQEFQYSPVKEEFALPSVPLNPPSNHNIPPPEPEQNYQSSLDDSLPVPTPSQNFLSPSVPEKPTAPSPKSPTASQVKRVVCSELEKLLDSDILESNLESSVDSLLPARSDISGKENCPTGYKSVKRVTLNELELCTPLQRQSHVGIDPMDSDSILCDETSDTDMMASVPESESSDSEKNDSQVVFWAPLSDRGESTDTSYAVPMDSARAQQSMERICDSLLEDPLSPVSYHSEPVCEEPVPSPEPEPIRVFAFSMIDQSAKERYYNLVLEMGGQVVESDRDFGQLTHVVAGRLCRSSKFLAAAAGGKWVLQPEFMEQCARLGTWCEESPYEWRSENQSGSGSSAQSLGNVPHYWRTSMESGLVQGPFHGMRVTLWVEKHSEILPVILTLGKAVVLGVQTPPYQEHVLQSITHVFVEDAIINERNERFLAEFKALNILPVSTKYVAEKLILPQKMPEDYEITGCRSKGKRT